MNQYLVYFLIGVAILLVSLVIPGLKVIAEAIFKALFELGTELLKHKGTFLVWFVKTVSMDHARVITHAAQSRNTLDPTQKIRRKVEGYEE